MKSIGNVFAALLLIIASGVAWAEVTATVDRDRVALGDTLRLTLTAEGDAELSDIDLAPLQADFHILQRSTSSSTRIVNGRRSHTRQLLLDITPKREGTLRIPPLRAGRHATNLLLVAVEPPPDADTGGQTVIFEAEVDRERVHVQGQVLLTLRLMQAINLDGRSISELELENAFVRPLEQRSFQRTIDGRPWLVTELRYAIFPEQSGELEIPAQSFTARESQSRRSFFDLGGNGRLLRRATETLTVEVLPRPADFPAAATWLPASSLNVEESWSTPPEQLKVGESATRTLRIRGEGLQGAQLPPIPFPATEGIKYYPDQPVISDTEVSSGLLGTRQDSAAVVPTRAGTWQIPEIRIPWWDTEREELRYAVVPGREIAVAAAATAAAPLATAPGASPAGATATPAVSSGGNTLPWQIATVVSALGWLLTLGWLVWSRRAAETPAGGGAVSNPSEARAFKQLRAACAGGSAGAARQAAIDWAAALLPDRQLVSLEQVAAVFADDDLAAEIDRLNQALYGQADTRWDGASLLTTVKRLREQHRREARETGEALSLYPRAA